MGSVKPVEGKDCPVGGKDCRAACPGVEKGGCCTRMLSGTPTDAGEVMREPCKEEAIAVGGRDAVVMGAGDAVTVGGREAVATGADDGWAGIWGGVGGVDVGCSDLVSNGDAFFEEAISGVGDSSGKEVTVPLEETEDGDG